MNRRMAAGSPASSGLQLQRVIHPADENVPAGNRRALDLRVTAQTEIRVAHHEHFLVDRTMRIMTNDAAFAHRRVFKDKRARLVAMTLRAAFILPRHGQAARRFECVAAMRIMALHATHVAFDDRMMLRQIKFRVDVKMALKTGRRVVARVDDEFSAATGLDVFAARTVARLAAGLAGHCSIAGVNSRVRTGGKFTDDVLMAIRAGLVADVMCAGNLQRHDHGVGRGGTGIQKQQ